jgi:hypothetical protein
MFFSTNRFFGYNHLFINDIFPPSQFANISCFEIQIFNGKNLFGNSYGDFSKSNGVFFQKYDNLIQNNLKNLFM